MKPSTTLAILLAMAISAPADDFFESKIRPVLVKNCYECRSEESGKSKGGLLLDTREGIRTGGDMNSTLPEAWRNRDYVIESFMKDKPFDQFIRGQLENLHKQRDASLASRRSGTSQAGGGSEMSGFEVVCINCPNQAHLSGRIFNEDGSPACGVVIELWEADANGRYIHTEGASSGQTRDPNFRGYGCFLNGSDGRYYFRAIRPDGKGTLQKSPPNGEGKLERRKAVGRGIGPEADRDGEPLGGKTAGNGPRGERDAGGAAIPG